MVGILCAHVDDLSSAATPDGVVSCSDSKADEQFALRAAAIAQALKKDAEESA